VKSWEKQADRGERYKKACFVQERGIYKLFTRPLNLARMRSVTGEDRADRKRMESLMGNFYGKKIARKAYIGEEGRKNLSRIGRGRRFSTSGALLRRRK